MRHTLLVALQKCSIGAHSPSVSTYTITSTRFRPLPLSLSMIILDNGSSSMESRGHFWHSAELKQLKSPNTNRQ